MSEAQSGIRDGDTVPDKCIGATRKAGGRGGGSGRVGGSQRRKVADRWQRVELTQSDRTLLQYCHEQRFVTFEQLCKIYKPKRHQKFPLAPIERRLWKLSHFNLIKRERVFTERRSVVLLGREGFKAICEAGRDRGLPYLATIDAGSFVHDRTLTDLRLFLARARLRAAWRSERILRQATGSRVVPDADFVWPRSNERIALELERTHKNLGRYRRIFTRHLHSAYPWILYLLADAKHLAWLFRSALPRLEKDHCWGIEKPPIHRLRFVLLDKLLHRGANATAWFKTPGSSEPQRQRLGDL